MNKIADYQCNARALFLDSETSDAMIITNNFEEKIDNIYTDAYTFCQVDNPQDPAGFCSNDEASFIATQQSDFASIDITEQLQLDLVIQDGFCSEEFYNSQDNVIEAYSNANAALEYEPWLSDTNRIVYVGTLA